MRFAFRHHWHHGGWGSPYYGYSSYYPEYHWRRRWSYPVYWDDDYDDCDDWY